MPLLHHDQRICVPLELSCLVLSEYIWNTMYVLKKTDAHSFIRKHMTLLCLPKENIGDTFIKLDMKEGTLELQDMVAYLRTIWRENNVCPSSSQCGYCQVV